LARGLKLAGIRPDPNPSLYIFPTIVVGFMSKCV
jgi:hypothetical protein